MCTECVTELGHCPMHFYVRDDDDDDTYSEQQFDIKLLDENDDQPFDVCICHAEYNHCVATNPSGHIAELDPNKSLENFDPNSAPNGARSTQTTATTTQSPETVEAMGFAVEISDRA